ncbi:MAG: hypothetical protein L0332_25060 [Chloroflexi bacterium]|nr:hypothetical protein [Chloroflexota bacterium]MCI0575160.1 hypothetical protein [Chloroflexota bacterium]MCI0647158.1 hypothetical protein [Chloroflexota bacterium]MCI0729966.1 hypothetical protein [Chloroflexota bacterium]
MGDSTYRVRLIHWNDGEAAERVRQLGTAGYDVIYELLDPAAFRALKGDPPDAFLIDLGRLPSQGRDVALALRTFKDTRRVPLLFIGGEPEKIARVRQSLPDAVYTTWDQVGSALEQAIANPPADPVVPPSLLAGYSGTPLPQKLGIKAGATVALVNAPADFAETLGELPEGAMLHWYSLQPEPDARRPDVTLWFTTSHAELEHNVAAMGAFGGAGRLWIIWPKKTSGISSDLSERVVREVGLAAGLVDYKVCAVDATWSGLCFTWRKGKG